MTTAIAGVLVGKSGTFGSGGETPARMVALGSEVVSPAAPAALFLFFFLAMAADAALEGRRESRQDNGVGYLGGRRESELGDSCKYGFQDTDQKA